MHRVQLTLIGSPLRAFQWAQDEHRTLSLSPQRVARKREVSEIGTISYDNSETVRDKMSVSLLLITNRKSHTGFRLVPTSMTLNAVIAFILRFSPNSTDFQADYITVVEDRPIMSVNDCLPVLVFYFWRKLSHTLQRGLSAIAEHLVLTHTLSGVLSRRMKIRSCSLRHQVGQSF